MAWGAQAQALSQKSPKQKREFIPKLCQNGAEMGPKAYPEAVSEGSGGQVGPKSRQDLQKLVRGPSFWIPWDTLWAPFGHPGTVFRPSDLQNQRFFSGPDSGSVLKSILGGFLDRPTPLKYSK